MAILSSRLILPLLLSCFISSLKAQNLCDIYDEDWTCPNETIRSENSFRREELVNCTEDLVGATRRLIELGEDAIELTDNGEAVMLIGRTGTGKSTLTYFLAGDNERMISYLKSRGNYLIKDCNGKISGNGTIESATIFPDLVVEPMTKTAYYDNPGFMDTREVCIEIANAHFMKTVADHLKKVKFVLVIDHRVLEAGQDRVGLTDMIRSVIRFIPNIEKYGNGIAMMGTKLKIDASEPNENGYIDDIKVFLRQNRPFLGGSFPDPDELRRALFIVDTLLNESTPNKIGIFRAPIACGPLSTLSHMQDNRNNMTRIVMENLQYVNSASADFNFSLSGEAKNAILRIGNELDEEVILSVAQFGREVYHYLISKFICVNGNNCEAVIADLQIVFSNVDFRNGYIDEDVWKALNFSQIIDRITNERFLPSNLHITPSILEDLEKNARYLEFLQNLDNLNIRVMNWLQPMKDINRDLRAQIVGFVSSIDQTIKRYLGIISEGVESRLIAKLNSLVTGVETNLSLLKAILDGIISAEYPLSKNVTGQDPSVYVREINANVESFSEGQAEIELAIIQKFSVNLDVLKNVSHVTDFTINPPQWIAPLIELPATAKNTILNVSGQLNNLVTASIRQFKTALYNYLSPKFTCVNGNDCDELIADLQVLFNNIDFLNGYTNEDVWKNLNFTQVVNRITNNVFLPQNFHISPEILAALEKNARYLDFLKQFENLDIDVMTWLQTLKDLRAEILNQMGVLDANVRTDIINILVRIKSEVFNAKMANLNGLQDIVDMNSQIVSYLAVIRREKNSIVGQMAGIKIDSFVNKTIDSYQVLGLNLTSANIVQLRHHFPLLNLLDLVGYSTVIKETERFYWLSSLLDLEGLISNEEIWSGFLLSLFNDLSGRKVQVEDAQYKNWWSLNGAISYPNDTKFRNFWSSFNTADIPTVSTRDVDEFVEILKTESPQKIQSLNSLLSITLADSTNCDKNSDISIFQGNFVSLEQVIGECIKKDETKTLVILAFHTIFIDGDLSGSYWNRDNLNVLIVSPLWWTNLGKSLNLNGLPGVAHTGNPLGKPGNPGTNAGNFHGIGQIFTTGMPNVIANGGNGGNGQSGAPGSAGQDGSRINVQPGNGNGFFASYQCQTLFIYISLKQYKPYRCDTPEGDGDYCIGSSGARYEIFGTAGTSGRDGEGGGKPGIGGYGGEVSFKVAGGSTQPTRFGQNGTRGEAGVGGRGGNGGLAVGDSNIVTIDIVDKQCKLTYQYFQIGNGATAPAGRDGITGGNTANPTSPPTPTYKVVDFDPHIQRFKEIATTRRNNAFLKYALSDFLAKIN